MFLIIGSVFLAIFICAQLFEGYTTRKDLALATDKLLKEIQVENDIRQKETEKYLNTILNFEQAQTNALLTRIVEHSWLRERYGPTLNNYDTNTWLASAMLLGTNKRLDFIQNLNEGKVTSLLILDDPPARKARKIPYEGEISLFAMESEEYEGDWAGPYVGISFNLAEEYQDNVPPLRDPALNPKLGVDYYMLYDVKTILDMDLDLLKRRIDEVNPVILRLQIDYDDIKALEKLLGSVYQAIAKAQAYLKSHPKLTKTLLSEQRGNWMKQYIPNFGEIQKADIEKRKADPILASVEARYRQIEMVWQYAIFIASGIFTFDPFNKNAPTAVAHIFSESEYGEMIYKDEVFYSYPLGCVSSTCEKKSINNPNQQGIQTYYEQNQRRLFFGNTAYMQLPDSKDPNKMRTGSLTLGIDASSIVLNLALSSHRMAFFAANDHILKGYNRSGDEISDYYSMIPLHKVLGDKKTGIIETRDGEKYYYVTMQPFQGLDFYFFLLNPLDKEFALVNSVQANAKNIISQVEWQTHLVIVFSLIIVVLVAHFIAKQITKPILRLSHATEQVKEGKLDEIELPPLNKKKKNEVEKLYEAFHQMVEGLKEKEKVKGVLNKVVSPSIAEEILKGNVQLGGEEKVVTVLFADIRQFTALSEKMLPHEVIDLLNACMTKISNVIDSYHGVIDKYVGDEVMALFGAPISSEDSAIKAVECAIEMIEVMEQWNHERKMEHAPAINMGIGIHTGVVVAGNMGAENRLNYTVLGSNVNLASRLCSAAEKQQILISKDTLSQPHVQEAIQCEQLQPIDLKGFSDPIDVYLVKGKKQQS